MAEVSHSNKSNIRVYEPDETTQERSWGMMLVLGLIVLSVLVSLAIWWVM